MNVARSIGELPRIWNAFWFAPTDMSAILRVRQSFGILVALQFAWYLLWVPDWLSRDGWLDIDAGRYFIGAGMPGTGSQYRWSILYWLTSPSAAQLVCLLGLLASGLMLFGIGGRLAPLGAWTCMMMVHHRAPWLTMPSEVLASAGLLYLAIAPGLMSARSASARSASARSACENPSTTSVLANVALRCLQVHWLLWIGWSLASMLQQTSWWDGTAIGILSEQGNTWLGKLTRTGWTSQILGFLTILLHVASGFCLCNRNLRGLGILLTAMLGIGYVLLTREALLGLTACCYAMAFVPYNGTDKI